jgi:hypothetical protein
MDYKSKYLKYLKYQIKYQNLLKVLRIFNISKKIYIYNIWIIRVNILNIKLSIKIC